MSVISIIGSIDSYSRYLLKNDLDQYGGKPVTVKINSLGGYVHEGVAMAQMLQAHGDVTVEITGFIASAATIVALGAKKVQMHTSSMWLAHRCMQWVDAWGNYNADEIQDMIAKLEGMKKNNEAIDLNIASIYLNKCKGKEKNMDDVKKMMTDATWMTAEECMDWGFVDELIEDGKAAVTDELKMVMNSMGIAAPGAAPLTAAVSATAAAESKEPSWVSRILDAITGKKEAEQDGEIQKLNEQISSFQNKVAELQKVSNDYDAIINLINSVSEDVKKESSATKKVQMMIDIINAIPATVPVQKESKEYIDKFAGMATDPVNSYVNE